MPTRTPEPKSAHRVPPGAAAAAEATGAAAGVAGLNAGDEHDGADDAEADYFESDDAESDLDSVESDVLDEADHEA